MKRILASVVVVIVIAGLMGSVSAQNTQQAKKDYWQQTVELKLKNVPFADALQQLFRGTPVTYTLPDGFAATIPFVSVTGARRSVLDTLCKAAPGVTYQIDGDKVTFLVKQPQAAPTANANLEQIRTTVVARAFQNAPFPQVVSSLLDPLKVNYTVSPGLGQARVTAVLNGLSVDDALNQVTRAAGANYSVQTASNGIMNYIFSPSVVTSNNDGNFQRQQMANVVSGFTAPSVRRMRGAEEIGPYHPEYTTYETISLRYVDASAVLPLAALEPELLVAKTGANFVTVHGRPGAIKRFKDVVAAVDRQESMPRAVRVKAMVEVTATEKTDGSQPETTRAETESVGLEGMRMPLTITATSSPRGSGVVMTGDGQPVDANGRSLSRNLELHMDVTPTVSEADAAGSAQTISLTGHGAISGRLPMEFSKDFDFASSLALGAKGTIAQGSAELGNASVGFTVSISASVETGRVQLPANAGQGGYSGGVWAYPSGNSVQQIQQLPVVLQQQNSPPAAPSTAKPAPNTAPPATQK